MKEHTELSFRLQVEIHAGHERPLRADARRNRERIIESARGAFADYGAEAQMDDIARRAGLGVGTLYRHFPDKEALMAELVRRKFRVLADNARAALNADGEPFEVFADLLRRGAELTAQDAGVQHVLMGAGGRVWMMASAEREELQRLTGVLMGRAQSAGTMRPDVGASDIPTLMCGVSATMAQDGRDLDWRRHLDLVIDALRAR
ncbi:MAG: TetR/AcrR family transcriptional regulator [Thermoleophilaceae bacterium]